MNMEKFIHMQRYYKTIAIMLICSLLLTGCTTRNSGQEDDTEVKTSYEFNADKSQVSEKSRSAYSENGYYYLMNGILWFYDINNNIATVVCSNANCEHKDENCNAYLMDEHSYDPLDLAGVTVKGLGNQLWYIDGYIYIIERDESGDYLVQYDQAFFNRKKICKITEDGEVLGMPSVNVEGTMAIYDGYLYYFSVKPVNANELADNDYHTTVYCKRISIDGKSASETLGSFQFAMDYDLFGAGSGGKVCVSENGIFYVAGYISRWVSKQKILKYKVYEYNLETHEFLTLVDNTSNENVDLLGKATGEARLVQSGICCAYGDSLYIVGNGGTEIYRINESGITSIYSEPSCKSIYSLVAYDGYIYCMESFEGSIRLVRMNMEGKISGQHIFDCGDMQNPTSLVIYGVDQYNVLLRIREQNVEGFVDKNVKPIIGKGDIATYAVLCMALNDDLNGNIQVISSYGN